MLGSVGEADDAVQETWLRLGRSDTGGIENLGGWLTTVVARACLNMLRSRRARRGESLDDTRACVPDPIVSRADGPGPEHEALLADSVGLALFVVLDKLSPAERLAFVLHDTFGVPIVEIAPLVDRSPTAARKLASRARRRVRGAATSTDTGLTCHREAVDAFLAASREGEFAALLAVLDPEVVVRIDGGAARAGLSREIRGARAVAEQTLTFSVLSPFVRPALVNGTAGVVVAPHGRPFAVMGFTLRRGKIVEIDVLADPARLRRLDLPVLDE